MVRLQPIMEPNQTIYLKPFCPHSHIGLCTTPVISTTNPGISLSSSVLNIVATPMSAQRDMSHSDHENFDTSHLQSGQQDKLPAQLVQGVAAPLCFNSLQLQQIQVPSQAFAAQSSSHSQNSLSNMSQAKCNQMLQIQISTPSSVSSNSTTPVNTVVSLLTGSNNQAIHNATVQIINRSSLISDSSSNLSDGSSKSNISDVTVTHTAGGNLSSLPLSASRNSNQRGSDNSSHDESGNKVKINPSGSSYPSITSNKGFECQTCGRIFTQKGNLKTHLMTHSGERPYECRTCGKNFTQKGNLDTHVKIHTATKDHKCHYCDRGFTQRGNLKTHIRSIHTKEKPYACGHCGKPFSQKGNMLTHFRTHDKEARFPCNICGKTFSQKGNLKTHQQRHSRAATLG